MFEDTTIFLLWVGATWALANLMLGLIDGLSNTTHQLETKLKKRLDEIIHRVKVEKDRDTYYWYDLDDYEFLAQGTTDEEIVNHLKSRFPDHLFFLPTNHVVSAKTNWQPKIVEINVHQ
jgi:hypothetical protein